MPLTQWHLTIFIAIALIFTDEFLFVIFWKVCSFSFQAFTSSAAEAACGEDFIGDQGWNVVVVDPMTPTFNFYLGGGGVEGGGERDLVFSSKSAR